MSTTAVRTVPETLIETVPLLSKLAFATIEDASDTLTRIAAERGNSMVVTPLGRPNVEYLCAQQPGWTLGHVIDLSR